MPRQARIYLPGYPYHLVQRGNNRARCFWDPEDYQTFLRLLLSYGRLHGVAVHAYCLMSNHYHLLVTPDSVTSIPATLHVVSSTYVQYVNRRQGRTGALWSGRHHASVVQTERYLLACYRYIEMNPVRAGMVARPCDYPWSSHLFNAGGETGWLAPHPDYLALGEGPEQRRWAYQTLFEQRSSVRATRELEAIRSAARSNRPLGEPVFREKLEHRYGVRFTRDKRGRPALESSNKSPSSKRSESAYLPAKSGRSDW